MGDENLSTDGQRATVYPTDRFLPSRSGDSMNGTYALLDEQRNQAGPQSPDALRDEAKDAYSQLLRRELLGVYSPSHTLERTDDGRAPPSPEKARVMKFSSVQADTGSDPFSLSPVSFNSRAPPPPRSAKRKIARVPFKVLDAPQLHDDFYLNLVDWSAGNVLAVGLNNCVYLWSACTSKVTKLCDLGSEDSVTAVSWTQRGNQVAVGTNRGEVQIWDPVQSKRLRTMSGHQGRVGAMAWNGWTLSTGSRDHSIMQRDVRSEEHYTDVLLGHRQEVCGLKWSGDEQQLASGGNDNKLLIWNAGYRTPVIRFSEHLAAVKAIGWSPHQHGLLASGGGTADRCIRFWNTVNQTCLNTVDTGSQVCNLAWSRNVNELVSTHGYSLNQIILWKYPSMTKVATLTGHTFRVLFLAISPDGQTIVTGAGDETLRFWTVFPGPKSRGTTAGGTGVDFTSFSLPSASIR